MQRKKISRKFWIKLISAPILMFFFAYALVPIYEVLCEITGFNGKTGVVETEKHYVVDEKRLVKVSFFASTMAGFPVQFGSKVASMEVVPGKFYTTSYIAKNNTDQVIVGQAIPSVAPSDAAIHFKKLECFCFTNQTFQPHEEVEMSLRFVIEPDISEHIKDVSLSYNFFKLKQ